MDREKLGGFTLIELVVFIVVISVAIVGLLSPLTTVLQKSPTSTQQLIATSLSQQRMEIILGQRRSMGYSFTQDPCTSGTPPAACNTAALFPSYTVTSTITPTVISGDPGYTAITVTTLGPGNVARSQLLMLVGSY